MKKIFYKTFGCIMVFQLFLCLQLSAGEDEEYWTMVPGLQGDHMLMLDTTLAFITVDFGMINDSMVMRNTLRFYHINTAGEITDSLSFNINNTEWLERVEVLRSKGRHKVHRLENGNILIGGHGRLVSTPKNANNFNEAAGKPEDRFRILKEQYDDGTNKKDNGPLVHPLIMTFNPALDSLLRIDTLEAVPHFGAVTLLHEVAPDTLIIGFHKTNESRQQIMETDSLFNVRWSTEFGQQNGFIADIYDFHVTSEGDYLVIMDYLNAWITLPLANKRNILFKFSKDSGELLWQKVLWVGKGSNTMATIAPWQDDKLVIALDDCCKKSNNQINFHEHTGMHLQIRDYHGHILEEKNLADFLSAYVKAFTGPDAFGDDLEDPENVAPWFIPHRIIRNPDQTYLITGIQYSCRFRPFGRGFLLKLDEELQPLWARIFEIDKKNYIYGVNSCFLFNVVATEDQIFLGGNFTTAGFWSTPSPLYPPNYPWNLTFFRKDVIIPLDEHGCYEPGCHLIDNVPYYELEQFITLTPNPANDRVLINLGHGAMAHKHKVLFISDLQGRKKISQSFSDPEITVSLNGFQPGIYLVYIMAEGQVFKAEKLVVR